MTDAEKIEKIRQWAADRYAGSGDYYMGYDAAQDAVNDILDED